jgi:hypothetical protein
MHLALTMRKFCEENRVMYALVNTPIVSRTFPFRLLTRGMVLAPTGLTIRRGENLRLSNAPRPARRIKRAG